LTFRENLRRLRLQRFWSQADLAREAGISKLTVHRLETGQTPPSLRSVRALAKALQVDPLELANPAEVAEQKRAAAWSS
jgi:transcriptional regulator with XRE-family HTH domain